jgi:hypothetical protein
MLITLTALTLSACTDDVAIESVAKKSDRAWASALGDIANPSGFQPAKLKQNQAALEAYLGWASTHGQHTQGWGESKEDKRLSYLLNVHNAAVLHSLLRHDFPERPDDVQVGLYLWEGAGMRWGTRYLVDNEWTSLAHMASHDTVNRYMEPLLWIGLYDGTRSAPPLRWWRTGKLQPQLERAARRFINSDRGMSRTDDGWAVNRLFIAHAADFVDWTPASSLCEWMAGYAKDERKDWLLAQASDCKLNSAPANRALDRAPRSAG